MTSRHRRSLVLALAGLAAGAGVRPALRAQGSAGGAGGHAHDGTRAGQPPVTVSPAAATASQELCSARRFDRPLRLPGREGLFAHVDLAAVREMHAAPSELEYFEGLRTPILAYRAEVDGREVLNPVLVARRGDRARLSLRNGLAQPTIVHWHGLTNDERNDGTMRYAVDPGGRYDYDFEVRDAAATLWYHPHPHGLTGEQVYRGLAGFLLLEDEGSEAFSREFGLVLGETDLPLLLQDRTFERSGALAYPSAAEQRMRGAFGPCVLVNHTLDPRIAVGRRVHRLRLLNGSNARTYRLSLAQGSRALDLLLVSTDGGFLETPKSVREVWLAPAQRADVLVDFASVDPGEPVYLSSGAFDALHSLEVVPSDHGGLADGQPFPILRFDPQGAASPVRVPARLPASPTAAPAEGEERRERDFMITTDGRRTWRLNGRTWRMDEVPINVARGARETWTFHNSQRGMPHPMHVHGFRFRVLSRRESPDAVRAGALDAHGRTAQDFGPLDTVLVWPGESVSVALDFTHPFPGDQVYMVHCHNLEHEDMGLMLNFRVRA